MRGDDPSTVQSRVQSVLQRQNNIIRLDKHAQWYCIKEIMLGRPASGLPTLIRSVISQDLFRRRNRNRAHPVFQITLGDSAYQSHYNQTLGVWSYRA